MLRLLIFCSFVVAFLGCSELNDPYYSGGSYGDPYYRGPSSGSPYYSGRRYDERREIREDRRDLERERRELERDRERLERDRDKINRRPNPRPASPTVAKPRPERCPQGFRPSERKCSKKERKQGCQDMRTPGGLGCVKR
jgi:hypothetical protein